MLIFAGYNCGNNNPCNPLHTSGLFYYTHENPHKFVQCSQWGQCYEKPCAPGTRWKQAALTCVHDNGGGSSGGSTGGNGGYSGGNGGDTGGNGDDTGSNGDDTGGNGDDTGGNGGDTGGNGGDTGGNGGDTGGNGGMLYISVIQFKYIKNTRIPSHYLILKII